MTEEEKYIAQTRKWITDVVIASNFCPFASKVIRENSIRYQVINTSDKKAILEKLDELFHTMNDDKTIETTLLIIPGHFRGFNSYLDLLDIAEEFTDAQGYSGIYQLASFHPEYLFAGSTNQDPSNYTNRSPYPMLHILREESVSKAIDSYPDVASIPEKNIKYATDKGFDFMNELKNSCMREIE